MIPKRYIIFIVIEATLLTMIIIPKVFAGHEECVVWNWGCKWVDNEVDCVKGDRPIRTDTTYMPVMVGKIMTVVPIVDDDYLYNCTQIFDNGTINKYQEIE